MGTYEHRLQRELHIWEHSLLKPSGLIQNMSKRVQMKINNVIPEKVHTAITSAVRGIVTSVLVGLDFVPKNQPLHTGLPLEERDVKAKALMNTYQKIAAVEGAGTGAGGIMLGLADFPALIAIKMKFLFELAHVYGYDTKDFRERLFLLHVFQLAFSAPDQRGALLAKIKNWEQVAAGFPPEQKYLKNVDWEQFQREYRDAIDFRKMLQLVPVIGAAVGAWANYGLLEELGVVAMNCYRLRKIEAQHAKKAD
ncbi:EcsC family protein [Tumebacillus sp. BK434]|uniref:EcsC family protein n=1 Tax=Tumebacillus sp. BK434 TaxID=2512169 RepID=UPI00104682E1|nr:EcsC family protein [Tumebacillus sp. BK434]TCP58318.1 EcsC family protein [Tumebacillus sp. BK434]